MNKQQNKSKVFPLLAALSCAITVGLVCTPARAVLTEEDCPSNIGYFFNGKNSGSYCISKIETKYWWTAFTWCTAIGGKLATWAEACPNTEVGTACPNINSVGPSKVWAWTAEPYGEAGAYQLITKNTAAQTRTTSNRGANNNNHGYVPHALCI